MTEKNRERRREKRRKKQCERERGEYSVINLIITRSARLRSSAIRSRLNMKIRCPRFWCIGDLNEARLRVFCVRVQKTSENCWDNKSSGASNS